MQSAKDEAGPDGADNGTKGGAGMKQVQGAVAAKAGKARRGVVTGWRMGGLHGDRRGLVAGVSALALAVSGALFSASTATAQVVPGDPECAVVGQTVTCSPAFPKWRVV